MAKEIDNKKLVNLGFNQVDNKTQTEDGILYDWFEFKKDDATIEVAKEYGYKGKCVLQSLYFNGSKMSQFKDFDDVKYLIGLV